MEFANEKDILRASTLGKHKSVVNQSEIDTARGKARTEASAIKDKKKILGRLEAMEDRWKDFDVVVPFIEKCIELWPEEPQYKEAKDKGKNLGIYLKTLRITYGLPKQFILNKGLLTSKTGKFFGTPDSYSYNVIGILIFNTYFKKYSNW